MWGFIRKTMGEETDLMKDHGQGSVFLEGNRGRGGKLGRMTQQAHEIGAPKFIM